MENLPKNVKFVTKGTLLYYTVNYNTFLLHLCEILKPFISAFVKTVYSLLVRPISTGQSLL